jgi:hypothetical protein
MSAPPAPDPARPDGIALLQNVIKIHPELKLPDFAAWPLRGDLSVCGQKSIRPIFTKNPRANFDSRRHTFSYPESTLISGRKGIEFQYSEETYKWLCGTVLQKTNPVPGAPEPPPSPLLRDGLDKISSWWTKQPSRPKEITPFREGMRASAIGFEVLPKPNSESDLIVVNLSTRDDNGNKPRRSVQVKIPKDILDVSPVCPKTPDNTGPKISPQTPWAPPIAVTIRDFFFLQLKDKEKYGDGRCGDYLILTNFNVMQRRKDSPAIKNNRWLWAAYWWDRDNTSYNVRKELAPANANPWGNYSMDATYDSNRFMFNPMREDADTNCAFCHYAGARIPVLYPADRKGKGSIDAPLSYMFLDFIFAPVKINKAGLK